MLALSTKSKCAVGKQIYNDKSPCGASASGSFYKRGTVCPVLNPASKPMRLLLISIRHLCIEALLLDTITVCRHMPLLLAATASDIGGISFGFRGAIARNMPGL